MDIKHQEAVQFTIASSADIGNGTLTGFTTLGDMTVRASNRIASTTAAIDMDACECDVWVTSTGNVRAQRNGTPALAITVTAIVTEWGADTNVFTGTYSIADATHGSGTNSIGGTVTTTNAFAWHHSRGDPSFAGGTADALPGGRCERLTLAATTVSMDRGIPSSPEDDTEGAHDGHFYVLEDSNLTVEHAVHNTGDTGSTSFTDTITTVTTDETFLMGSYKTNCDDNANQGSGHLCLDLQNSTTLRWRRQYGTTYEFDCNVAVVSASELTVQRGEMTHGTTTGSAAITAVADVDLSIPQHTQVRSGMVALYDYGVGFSDSFYHELWLSSTTQIDSEAGATQSSLIMPWEVVEFPADAGGPARRIMVIS